MSNFACDADLLDHEPNVFFDLPFASQRRVRVTDGELDGVSLSSAAGGFSSLEAGDVVVIEVSASERTVAAIEEVVNGNTLTLREAPVVSGGSELVVEARTFKPQTTVVHEELMRAIGIDIDDMAEPLDESSIVSVALITRLECLGTLSRAYASAVALAGDNEAITAKATEYRQRFHWALNAAQVLIDTDGDGEADIWRSPGVARLIRM